MKRKNKSHPTSQPLVASFPFNLRFLWFLTHLRRGKIILRQLFSLVPLSTFYRKEIKTFWYKRLRFSLFKESQSKANRTAWNVSHENLLHSELSICRLGTGTMQTSYLDWCYHLMLFPTNHSYNSWLQLIPVTLLLFYIFVLESLLPIFTKLGAEEQCLTYTKL